MTAEKRFYMFMALAGAIGAASIGLVPFEQLGDLGTLTPLTIRLAATVQPVLLAIVLALAGCWAAPKMGLEAPWLRALAERRKVVEATPTILFPTIIVAGLVAVMLVVLNVWSGSELKSANGPAAALAEIEMPLATKILYGGIAEEIMVRWGLLSLIALGLMRLRLSRIAALGAAAVISSLIFAAGHLPLLYQIVEAPSASLVMTILSANAVAGLAFAVLFIKRGLEAAILAHAGAHTLSTAWLALMT